MMAGESLSPLALTAPTVATVAADSRPYRRLDPPVPVLAPVDGTDYPALAEGWRGDRVRVDWGSGIGLKHTRWLPASSVRRLREN
jgi:hypothetical protein